MKKVIYMCLMAVMAIGLTGCNNNDPISRTTIDLVVSQDRWQFDEETRQFYCQFYLNELTANVYNYGEISISREFNSGMQTAYQVALPMSTYMTEEVTYDDGTTDIWYYTQHIDYRIGIGYVEIQLTNSDYMYADQNPESMLFRMQITY